jgi:hypothetical protein
MEPQINDNDTDQFQAPLINLSSKPLDSKSLDITDFQLLHANHHIHGGELSCAKIPSLRMNIMSDATRPSFKKKMVMSSTTHTLY